MTNLVVRVVAAVVVLASACSAPEAPKFTFTHAERRGRFANGLRFVLMPDATTQMVQVDVRYEVGSREDPQGKAGLAHLVEHLMFQQRPDGPSSPPLMQSINELSTSFNAYTTWDKTHYTTGGRRENLDALLKIEAMRLFYGCQTISPDEFAREREVVRNELRERSGTAEGQIPQVLLSAVYPKGHAYERMVGGDDRQVAALTLDDACAFIAKYYAPERATLIIAGGFEVDPAIHSLEQWFGRIARRTAGPRVAVEPVAAASGKVEVELDVERPSVHVIWPLPPRNTPDGEAVEFGLFATVFRVAAHANEYDFAYEVQPQVLGGDLAPAFAISISLRDIDRLDEALDFVRTSARQAHRGFDQGSREEIEEAVNRRKAAFIAELEPLGARTHEMADLVEASGVDFDSQELYVFHELDKIGRFDGARVAAAIKRYIDPDRARIVVVRPSPKGPNGPNGKRGDQRSSVQFTSRSDDQIAVTAVDPEDAKRPIALPPDAGGLTTAKRFALDNGLQVALLPVKAMPLVSARLIFNNAGAAAAPDRPALATAAARFLLMPFDAEAFGRAGIDVGCRATADATICGSSGMNIYQDLVVRSLDRLVTAGLYNQKMIEHWQKNLHDRFSTRQRQDVELRRQLFNALYGAEHPYARIGAVTPSATDSVHLDALNEFRKQHYTASNATLIVVGDFEPAQLERKIRDTFGSWAPGTLDPPVSAAVPAHSAPVAIGVVGGATAQLRVVIGYPSPGIDRAAGVRTVLAEMLNLRAGDVRFKLGSTYGVYARHLSGSGPGAYEIGGGVDADRAGESIKALRDGIAALRGGEHFAEDFVRARRKVASELLGQSTVTGELADRLGFIAIHGLAPDHYRALLQQVAAVTPAQVQALLHDELPPEHEVLVVLGDRAHLEQAFAGAGVTGAQFVEPAEH